MAMCEKCGDITTKGHYIDNPTNPLRCGYFCKECQFKNDVNSLFGIKPAGDAQADASGVGSLTLEKRKELARRRLAAAFRRPQPSPDANEKRRLAQATGLSF